MFILFDFIYLILFGVYIPYLTYKRKWHRGFGVRCGFLPGPLIQKLRQQPNVWIHAVSVGEVLLLEGFIEKLKLQWPRAHIVCSTVTKTGFSIASRHFKECTIIYAPLDFSWIVRKFVRAIRPQIYIAAETEIWPNLFRALGRHQIPAVVINGRISDRAFKGYRRIRFWMRMILKDVRLFCMQSDLDASRIIALGADPARVRVAGNVKFDQDISEQAVRKSDYGFPENSRLWMAGSTHPGEEGMVVDIFKKIVEEFRDLRLVICPRHVERVEDVMAVVKEKGLNPLRLSELPGRNLDAGMVVIVDSMGHLRDLYAVASVVFVGKSLAVQGGQNMIEPAFFGKPILVGPHTQNFRDVMEIFLKARALIQVRDEQDLNAQVTSLLRNPQEMREMGRRARAVMERNRGVADKTIRWIEEIRRDGPCLFEKPQGQFLKAGSVPSYLYSLMTDQRNGTLAVCLKFFLGILSVGFALLIQIRRFLYDKGILKSMGLPKPVISVGNMTLGGTGKTPLVEFLSCSFRRENIQPAILTRGYMQPRGCGDSDEASMLRRSLGDVPVLAGADRVRSARDFLRNHTADVFILDDGFQHWRLKRDLDIVTVDAVNPWGNGHLLPRGILREPLKTLKRADVWMLMKTDLAEEHLKILKDQLKHIAPEKLIVEAVHKPVFVWDLLTQEKKDLSELSGKTVGAVCSLAQPQSFERTLRHLGALLKNKFFFLDHHGYTKEEIRRISGRLCEQNVKILVTTEKDAVKLAPLFSSAPKDFQILVLRIEIDIVQGKEQFFDRVHSVLLR